MTVWPDGQRHLNDWPTWIKDNCVHLFRTYGSLGNTWAFFFFFFFFFFCFFFIFSLPLLIISPSLWLKYVHPGFITCKQVRNNPTITAFVFFFKSSPAHLRRCIFCSSVSKWGTHLAQTFLRSKRFFQNCLHTAFWYASTTSYIFDRQSRILFDHKLYSSDVSLGNRGFRPSQTGIIFNRKFPSFKSFNPPKTVRIEMVWGPYIPLIH